MNLTAIELGRYPRVQVGDVAVLLDDDPASPASVYRWAELLDTIPYEVLTTVGAKAPSRIQQIAAGGSYYEKRIVRAAG
jgi:alanine racemase